MRFMKPQICRPLLALALGSALGMAQAQTAPDPTRPPEAWLALQPQVAVPGATPEANENSGVKVTVTGKNRRYALVDGQVVKTGDIVNGARVVAIGPNAVTLQQNNARTVMSVAPGVTKKTSQARRSAAPGKIVK